MSNFLGSKKIRAVLLILGSLIILFVVFGLGITVGYERAGFASRFDKNYSSIFFGRLPGGYAITAHVLPGGPMGMMTPSMPGVIHGVVGTIIDIGTSTVSVENQNGDERSVVVSSGTDIRYGQVGVSFGSIAVGDMIAAIGEPNNMGQIDARFIRIFPASSSIPTP